MKKILFVLLALVLIATPVFATTWSVGAAGGYPQSGILGQVEFDQPVKLELMAGIDYNYSKPVAFGMQFYGTYGFKLTDLITLNAGIGATSRITDSFYIAPAARIGAEFNIKNLAVKPFVRGDFGYAIGASKFFWEATGGVTYTF